MEIITISYILMFPHNRQEIIELRLDSDNLLLLNDVPADLPLWTKLDFYQCPNCLLNIEEHPYCPSAVHYVKLLPIFQSLMSYEEVEVKVIDTKRITFKKISAQKAVSSLIGLIHATSGCPHTVFFRPMARFHLPFSDAYETTYRVTSMYLLAQYFLLKQGRGIDIELQGLKNIYSNVQKIDEAMFKRLQFVSEKDVVINALASLDALAKIVELSIEESLGEYRDLFTSYINRNIINMKPVWRREQRIIHKLPINFYYHERLFCANTINLSHQGLCVEITDEAPINVGDTIDIVIGDIHRVKAEVMWKKKVDHNSFIGILRDDTTINAMRPKILLIDDEEEFVSVLAERLSLRGYDVRYISQAKEALPIVQDNPPQIVLLDIKMPRINGIDTLKEIKQINPHIDVIILTGYGEEDNIKETIKSGAFAYIVKPVEIEALIEIINKALITHGSSN